MTVRYDPRGNDFAKIAERSPELHAALADVADRAKTIAEGLAQSSRDTGNYADSFGTDVETIPWEGRYPGRRMAGVLANTSPHAAAVEWGNQDVTVYRKRSGHEFVSAEYAAAHPDTTEAIKVSYPDHRILGRTLDMLDRP